MRLTAFFLTLAVMHVSAKTLSQTVSVVGKNLSIQEVFDKIERQTGYEFLVDQHAVEHFPKQTLAFRKASLAAVLDMYLRKNGFDYEIRYNSIIITPLPAQDNQPPPVLIHGQVMNDSSRPVEGVSVYVKGTRNGTTTDAGGHFTLRADDGKVLVFSIVGYSAREIPINGRTEINVTLSLLDLSMDELTVVSYGTQRRGDVTGSIATAKASALADIPVGQFAQKLQGQMPGVNVNINTGKPGQGIAIQVRGAASINAGNYPLVVVDGQPLAPSGGINPINNINPDEIESFTVLKDASASALYGSRAANGVVLVTTKSAKAGKTQVDFSSYYALASLDKSHVPKMMDARQLATFMNEYFQDKIANEGWVNPQTGTATVPSIYANPSQYGKGTNWLNQLTRTAPTQNYSLSFSDARPKSSTSIVGGYFRQEGIIKNSWFARYSIRANNEFRPTEFLKLGLNVAPSVQIDHNSQGAPTDGPGGGWEILGTLVSSPLVSPYNADGTLSNQASSYYMIGQPNWEKLALNQNNVYTTTRMLGNTYLELKLLKSLVLRTALDVDLQGQTQNRFSNEYASAGYNYLPPTPISNVSGNYSTTNTTSWVNENTLNYKTVLGGDHRIEALAGYTTQKYSQYSNAANGSNYSDQSIPYVSAAGTTSGSSSLTQWALASMIGRLNYGYKDKYLLSGAIRRDGSSKFGVENQYGTFPSVSGGWVISEEPFMRNFSHLSFLKLRASYGLTGNNNFNSGDYPSISLISPVNYVLGGQLVGGRYVSQLGNSLLTWEKTKQTDIGLDIDLFKGRIQFTYDYYYKLTDGLLYQVNIPRSSGFGSVNSNIGTFKFWGHEFAVNSRNLVGKLTWSTNFNISFNRNQITRLGTQNLSIMPGNEFDNPNIQMVGQPIGMFYGYVNDGVYMNQQEYSSQPHEAPGSSYVSGPGTVRMKDINKDGVINSNDRTVIGNPNPKFIYGITNTFTYRKFDLNIVLSGSYGNKIEDENAQRTANLDGAFNLYANQLDHWRSPSDPGNGLVPSTKAGTTTLYRAVQSLWVHDGSYLACRNIALGYNIGLPVNKYVNKLRAYISVQQAFVITKYPGLSPETNSQSNSATTGLTLGVDNSEYPIPRTIAFGLNMSFF